MSLTEKTLELNITHELLSAADRLWELINFAVSSPRLIRTCHCTRPIRLPRRLRPPFASGLSLIDEEGRGWDVKIELPRGWPGARAVFLQFKRGDHRGWSNQKGSAFYSRRGRHAVPKPHCRFGINNNSKKDQHSTLRGLAGNPGLAAAVHYAFPRLSNRQGLLAHSGQLVAMTSFFTVSELDSVAIASGLKIVQGKAHDFAMDYSGIIREVRSEPIAMRQLRPANARVLGDVVATRAWRALLDWAPHVRDSWHPVDRRQVNWGGVFDQYVIDLARAWIVSPETVRSINFVELDEESVTTLQQSYETGLRSITDALEPVVGQAFAGDLAVEVVRHAGSTFETVVGRLSPYRELMASERWIEQNVEPPDHEASVEVPTNGIELEIEGRPDPALTYMLF